MSERTLYFGLGSNVQFFASHLGFAKLINRVKALSLLYDRILFREGVYEATIGEDGAMTQVGPAMGRDQLKPLRNRRGVPFVVMIGKDGTSERVPMIATPIVQRYRAQFITLLNEMTAAKADWVDSGQIAPDGARIAAELAKEWTDAEEAMVSNLWPDKPWRLRNLTHRSLNLDLATASLMGMHLAPDGIHYPLLLAKAADGRAELVSAGEHSLRIALPQITEATWEDIVELRKDRGLASLRTKLAELDQVGLDSQDVYQRVVQELLDDLDRRRPQWVTSGLWAVASIVAGPFGPIVSCVEVASTAAQSHIADRRWMAALLRARRRLNRSVREQAWLRLS